MNKKDKDQKEKSAAKQAISAFKKSLQEMDDPTLVKTIKSITEGMLRRAPKDEIHHQAETLLRYLRVNSATRDAYFALAEAIESQAIATGNSPLLKLARTGKRQCQA